MILPSENSGATGLWHIFEINGIGNTKKASFGGSENIQKIV